MSRRGCRQKLWFSPISPVGVAMPCLCLSLYAYPAGTSFCSCKRKQNTLGEHPETPDAWLRWIRILFFCGSRKIISVRRADALKKCPRRIFIARALEREGRTTTPLPSSEEGNYGGSGQILCSQPPPLCRKSLLLFLASVYHQSAPHPQPPPLKGEGAFCAPNLPPFPKPVNFL